jgi:uncharacterized protein (DUF488 family)
VRQVRIFSIGHSNQALDSFLDALGAHCVQVVADVRRFPSSRRHPHFSRAALADALAQRRIDYIHMPELGGHREPRPDSPNTAWREPAFRGYADYMETPAFAAAIDALLARAEKQALAVMCAERRWFECHRRLISDYLMAAGHEVVHIVSAASSEPHSYGPAVRVADGRLSYRGLL